MERLTARIVPPERYPDALERSLALLISRVTVVLVVAYTIFAVVSIVAGLNLLPPMPILLLFYLLGVVVIIALQRGASKVAGWVPLAMYLIAICYVPIFSGLSSPQDGTLMIIPLLIAGLLKRRLGLLVAGAITIILVIVGLALYSDATLLQRFNTLLIFFLVVCAASALIIAFLNYAAFNRKVGFSEASDARVKLAEITTQVARSISSRVATQEVLDDTVNQIIANFLDIYHAQIFLVEPAKEGKIARLASSTGEVGKLLMARQHSLPVGSLSVIGGVTISGQHLIAVSGAQNTIHRKNEFLPETAVEAAFPLRIGDEVIGALDLQSKNKDAFPEVDAPIYQSLADSVALAIENARLFEERENRIRENQRLVEQTRNALREVEQLNERLTGRAWADYLRERREAHGVTVDFEADRLEPTVQLTPTLRDAMLRRNFIQQQQGDAQIVAVPLMVRGQVIGAVEFELDGATEFSTQDLDLLQEVSERFGLAAENNRLLEESQRIAHREALVNEIGRRLQGANNVEAALSEAVRSLQEVLKAERVAIRLGEPPQANSGGKLL